MNATMKGLLGLVVVAAVGVWSHGAHAQGAVCNNASALRSVDLTAQAHNIDLSQAERGAACEAVSRIDNLNISVDNPSFWAKVTEIANQQAINSGYKGEWSRNIVAVVTMTYSN